MKLIFFDKVVGEGTPEECMNRKKELLKKLRTLDKVLRETPVEKDSQVIFETLEFINPAAYEMLCDFKELIGETFIEYQFVRMCLPGVLVWVQDDLAPNQRRTYILGHIFHIILMDERGWKIWRIEE